MTLYEGMKRMECLMHIICGSKCGHCEHHVGVEGLKMFEHFLKNYFLLIKDPYGRVNMKRRTYIMFLTEYTRAYNI